MRASLVRILGCLALLIATALPAAAQTGTVVGTVVDTQSGQPVAGAQVQALRGTSQMGGALADSEGRFRLQLAVGNYSLVVTVIGYGQERVDDISVLAGQTTQVTIDVTSTALQLGGIVVTGIRSEENAISSIANIQSLTGEKLAERASLSVGENAKAVPGVDVVQSGITSSNIVARGFNNVFSGALLVLTDNRYAFVPSLRFNAYNMIPTNQFDIERMEIMLGPGAALYGPNSASGVMHVITTSPIDDPGTKVSISGGERDVLFGQFRTALKFSDNAGLKLSGQYFQGREWECGFEGDAPGETCWPSEYQARIDNPTLKDRDYDAERMGGELRFDWRNGEGTSVIVNAGMNQLGSSIEMTGIGAGQAFDWLYSYGQVRFRTGRFFAQAFINQSDAGDTFLFETGNPIIDESRMMVAQFQQGFGFGERQDFIVGLDLQRTDPRTGGTINGRNEDDDEINEVGGYLHSETRLTDRLKFVTAVRTDYHNRLEDLVFSPRAALVFEPVENQAIRATYNRAFSTPTTNNLFLDIVAGSIPLGGGAAYNVRTRGVPESGFTFDDTCTGGVMDYCMYTPFAPQLGQIPANAALLWNDLVGAVAALGGADPATIAQLLALFGDPGSRPGDPAIGSMLMRFNQEARSFDPDPGATPIDRMLPTIYNTYEIGYNGILGGKVRVSADVYYQKINDFVGPLRPETPNVFYDSSTFSAYLDKRVQDAIALGALPPGTPTSAVFPDALRLGLAQIPVGTVAPDQGDNSDILLTYRNFGDVDLFGADFAFQYISDGKLSLNGTYSYVSEECFDFNNDGSCTSARDIALNAPTHKGSIGFRWADEISGVTFDGRARFTGSFPMNSGVYTGEVEGYTVFDANIAYKLPWAPGATIGLTASNIFDDMHQEFVGAPFMGRMILARMQYEF